MKLPWVSRKRFEDMYGYSIGLAHNNDALILENTRLQKELDACWKCINSRSNKGHWEKQKRVKGRFAK